MLPEVLLAQLFWTMNPFELALLGWAFETYS